MKVILNWPWLKFLVLTMLKNDELMAMFQYIGKKIKPMFSITPRNGSTSALFQENSNGEMIVNRFRTVSSTAEWVCDGNWFGIS